MGEGDEDNKLKNAVLSALSLASEKGLKSVSMPAISSGIFGFPKTGAQRFLSMNQQIISGKTLNPPLKSLNSAFTMTTQWSISKRV